MPVVQHTQRRGGIYHLRCRVPSDLVPVIGRGEIHRSLAMAGLAVKSREVSCLTGL